MRANRQADLDIGGHVKGGKTRKGFPKNMTKLHLKTRGLPTCVGRHPGTGENTCEFSMSMK